MRKKNQAKKSSKSQKQVAQSVQNQQQALQQNQYSPTYRRNVLLIIVAILFFIAVLFILKQQAVQREQVAVAQQLAQQQHGQLVPYEELVVDETQQKVQAIPDVVQVVQEERVVTEQEIIQQEQQQQAAVSQDLGQATAATADESSEYNNYFLGNCKDSDGGKNFYEAGTTVSKTGTPNNDVCNSNAIQYPHRLYEFFCDTNEMARKMTFECPNDCKDGACVAAK